MWILVTAFALTRGAAGPQRPARPRRRACISVPRSATYVTNVRYSLGESRVRYVKSAVTLRACVWRALRHRGTRERRSARMQLHATALRVVGREERRGAASVEERTTAAGTSRRPPLATACRIILRGDLIVKCRGRTLSFKFETKIHIQECHRF